MERMRRNGSSRRFRGVALAEAALVMMLLCTVTLGALQYGWFFYCLHTATNAARQGARVASVLDGTIEEGTAALQNALFTRLLDAATSKQVTPATVGGQPAVQGEVVIPAAEVALLPISFLPVPACQARVRMAKEQ